MLCSSKTLSAFLASDDGRPLIFEQLPFDHPLASCIRPAQRVLQSALFTAEGCVNVILLN